ncbi:MAG: hypothetical protein UX02_C0002G0185 [Candidatus Moranbacteria bacterium GW2011_GWC1_45_18]|nr:MAG: hypothetical protein UT79_C0001G0276 [Candidatus Moranbacteria bacterium GW2011_GWC2_40_12]KKT32803.1 MAG: hypothetical protein UW19_C0015G0011 [Candidatus Moranbacteria bacterium GW2011_GWF2_44_10]KKT99866.1 MAG: hypothetical protein UX02_C0002G0185 [Candidatus Moranbacteria bacterium GW2011_GWC1_45_18]OGI22560.1 MAG: hypothetical protein A2194_03700 [Candidatus Moranbacteria bacterium RIFOXYA1_FULL_44_8]OGI34408.1 MAG: hypothetical protein A2407_04170 [Candidatus Moranbacteria bacteri
MGLLDDYSQNSDDSGGASDPGDIRRQKMELESQIVISESNLKKILREREILEIEQRRLKKSEERIRVERDALDRKLKKIQENQRYSEEEIRGLKKKMKIIQ